MVNHLTIYLPRWWETHIHTRTSHTHRPIATIHGRPKWVFWRTKIEISSFARRRCFVEFLMGCKLMATVWPSIYDDRIVVRFFWFSCCCLLPLRLPLPIHLLALAGNSACGVFSWWSSVVVDGWCRCVFLVESIYFRTCDERNTSVCLFATCEDFFLLFPPITMRRALHIAHECTNWRSESLDVGFLCMEF